MTRISWSSAIEANWRNEGLTQQCRRSLLLRSEDIGSEDYGEVRGVHFCHIGIATELTVREHNIAHHLVQEDEEGLQHAIVMWGEHVQHEGDVVVALVLIIIV